MIVIGRTRSLFPEGLNPCTTEGWLIRLFVPCGPVEHDSIACIIHIHLFTKKNIGIPGNTPSAAVLSTSTSENIKRGTTKVPE